MFLDNAAVGYIRVFRPLPDAQTTTTRVILMYVLVLLFLSLFRVEPLWWHNRCPIPEKLHLQLIQMTKSSFASE